MYVIGGKKKEGKKKKNRGRGYTTGREGELGEKWERQIF